jgi:hypothetical protein
MIKWRPHRPGRPRSPISYSFSPPHPAPVNRDRGASRDAAAQEDKRATGTLSLRGGPHLFAFPKRVRARANAPLSSFPWSCCSVRQGRACSSVPAYRRSARSLSKARQRHRSHAQTIRAVVRIVEHGEEPPFDRRAREGLPSSRRGRAPILTSSAYRGDNPPINRNDLRGARQAASIIAPRPCIRRIFARSKP